MRFLVDAQLPARLARFLKSHGHDAIHSSELPQGNRTEDAEIAAIADAEHRIVITKDRDFRDSHLLNRYPQQLLLVSTGNLANTPLLNVILDHLDAIIGALADSDFVELTSTSIVVHPGRSRP